MRVPVDCRLTDCHIRSIDAPPRTFFLKDADLTIINCQLEQVRLDITDSRVAVQSGTLDGQPLVVPK